MILIHKGYFIAAEYLSQNQFIHCYHGEYYLEDGTVINYENTRLLLSADPINMGRVISND